MKEKCDKCLCSSCSQNAENFVDGLCRECETCKEDGNRVIENGCSYYTNDNDPRSLLCSNEEPGRPAYDEAYYEEHEDLEDKYTNAMW